MNKSLTKAKFFLFCLFALLSACTTTQPSKLQASIADIDIPSSSRSPSIVRLPNDDLATLYLNTNGRVTLQMGKQVALLDETARTKSGSGFLKLIKHENALLAFWWSHTDGKAIYFARSGNGEEPFSPVIELTRGDSSLAPYSVLTGIKTSAVGLVYPDERLPGTQVFFNRSADGGKNWNERDQRMDLTPAGAHSSTIQDPIAVQTDSAWIVVWTDIVRDGPNTKYRLMATRSTDDGVVWSSPTAIYVSDRALSSLAGSASSHHAVVGVSVYGRGILAAVADAQGENWRISQLAPGSADDYTSGIQLAVLGESANLVWIQRKDGEKSKILHARLGVKDATWSPEGAQRLDKKEVELTRSTFPNITVVGGKALLATWTDYRAIIPGTYFALSSDGGGLWTSPAPMEDLSVRWPASWPQIIAESDGVLIAEVARPAFDFNKKSFLLEKKSLQELEQLAANGQKNAKTLELAGVDRAERLKERLNQFWKARVEGKVNLAYSFFDPVYRATTTLEAYASTAGIMQYHDYKFGDIVIKGNEATVPVTIKYEIKSLTLPGIPKPMSVAPTSVDADSVWVWILNDWYQVFSSKIMKDQPLEY